MCCVCVTMEMCNILSLLQTCRHNFLRTENVHCLKFPSTVDNCVNYTSGYAQLFANVMKAQYYTVHFKPNNFKYDGMYLAWSSNNY